MQKLFSLIDFAESDSTVLQCPKSNPNFRDIARNVEENEILHEIFRVVSRFPRYISCYFSKKFDTVLNDNKFRISLRNRSIKILVTLFFF